MHVHFLDPYRAHASPVHQLDPRVKLCLAIAFIFTTALTPPGAWPVYVLLLSIALAVDVLSDLGVMYVLRRAVLALPFVLAALPILFTAPGPALFQVDILGWTLNISQTGLERFISITLKSWISIQMAIVLAASTSFPDLLKAMRAIKIPRLLVAIFGLMWRYLFVLTDEALRMLRARSSRSGQLDRPDLKTGGSLPWRARVAGSMAGSLFLRGYERSDRIYVAMLSRGYDGEVRGLPLSPVGRAGWLVLVLGLVVLALILSLGFLAY